MFYCEENWDSNGATEDWDAEESKAKTSGTVSSFVSEILIIL